jgi:hypothetical protein
MYHKYTVVMGLQALQMHGYCGRNAEHFNVKAGGYHRALKG